jgi:pyruvate formate lyase activating enzyme
LAYGDTASVAEILKEVEKDSVFYYHSGGGVTVSGGEPFVQPEFLRELLVGCLMRGINTAVETSGHVPWENIAAVLPYIDTLFYDLKHMDSEKHREVTGVGNRLILENLKKIDAARHPSSMIVRMPTVPAINDGDDNLRAMGRFCKDLKKLKEIQLLPYHRLGIETYRALAKPYALEAVASPGETEMEPKAALLQEMGLEVRIGGY